MSKNEAPKKEAETLWVKVYATEWEQCIPVDRIEWTGSGLQGWLGDRQVLYLNVAAVNAVFVMNKKS